MDVILVARPAHELTCRSDLALDLQSDSINSAVISCLFSVGTSVDTPSSSSLSSRLKPITVTAWSGVYGALCHSRHGDSSSNPLPRGLARKVASSLPQLGIPFLGKRGRLVWWRSEPSNPAQLASCYESEVRRRPSGRRTRYSRPQLRSLQVSCRPLCRLNPKPRPAKTACSLTTRSR